MKEESIYSIGVLIAILQDLQRDGYSTLTENEILNLLKNTKGIKYLLKKE